jgi:hypothetical protein
LVFIHGTDASVPNVVKSGMLNMRSQLIAQNVQDVVRYSVKKSITGRTIVKNVQFAEKPVRTIMIGLKTVKNVSNVARFVKTCII